MQTVKVKAFLQAFSLDIPVIIEQWDELNIVFLCEITVPVGHKLYLSLPELDLEYKTATPLAFEVITTSKVENMNRNVARFISLKEHQADFICKK